MVAVTRITRSKSSTPSMEISRVEKVEVETLTKVGKITKKKTVAKVVTTTKPKGDVEDALAHISVPVDLQLPESFRKFHHDDFLDGVKHIVSVDPKLYPVVVYKDFPLFAREGSGRVKSKPYGDDVILSYWYSLVSSVISQQVSGAAALSIENKFRQLFAPNEPLPKDVLLKTHEELRGAGLSNKKVEYVQHLSEHFSNVENKLAQPEFYQTATDEEIAEELVNLKGIGPWSAKMFLVFTLQRLNVFAHDDLGVARGAYRYLVKRQHILEEIKQQVKASEDLTKLLAKRSKFATSKGKRDWTPYHDVYIKQLGERFEPYSSIMMLLLWRLSSTNVDVLEGSSNKNEN
ncbi:DNA-3-methyladenine glycosylase [[Candida] anglica]|uniref:DNA-3-methyladenine glycosylase n=1 Tax=[Candida] anglica TaxID=148631 RepID=A0ABP0EJ73_9ASCO